MRSEMKLALAAVLSAFASTAPALGQSGMLQQQTDACNGDALKFCSEHVPDHAKIHQCLVAHKASLTPACREMVSPAKQKRRRQT